MMHRTQLMALIREPMFPWNTHTYTHTRQIEKAERTKKIKDKLETNWQHPYQLKIKLMQKKKNNNLRMKFQVHYIAKWSQSYHHHQQPILKYILFFILLFNAFQNNFHKKINCKTEILQCENSQKLSKEIMNKSWMEFIIINLTPHIIFLYILIHLSFIFLFISLYFNQYKRLNNLNPSI